MSCAVYPAYVTFIVTQWNILQGTKTESSRPALYVHKLDLI